jgi:hypothetical protein
MDTSAVVHRRKDELVIVDLINDRYDQPELTMKWVAVNTCLRKDDSPPTDQPHRPLETPD